MLTEVWIFHGVNSTFTTGVFTQRDLAEAYIAKYKLSGILTLYPIDEGVYDWALKNKRFTPKKDSERSVEFIQRFTTASQEHYHYEDGDLIS